MQLSYLQPSRAQLWKEVMSPSLRTGLSHWLMNKGTFVSKARQVRVMSERIIQTMGTKYKHPEEYFTQVQMGGKHERQGVNHRAVS